MTACISPRRLAGLALCVVHLLLAGTLLVVGVVEFCVEPPVFDVLGPVQDRGSIPRDVFRNITTVTTLDFGRIMDLPVLILFLCYFMTVVWLKCRGFRAWLLTGSMVLCVAVFVPLNIGLVHRSHDWRFFNTRAVALLLDVLIVSFGWTMLVMVLLNIRNWYPFKVKKAPAKLRHEVVALIIWNFLALLLILSLCLLIWFSKLYISWACVRSVSEIQLLCQFTNQIQCYQCESAAQCTNLTACVDSPLTDPFHCLTPLYTLGKPYSAFCVFNYNIGMFTFVTVFSYVGGIYFFLRTILNAVVKCLRVIFLIIVKYCYRAIRLKQRSKEPTPESPTLNVQQALSPTDDDNRSSISISSMEPEERTAKLSLLASLPRDYSSTGKSKAKKSTFKTKSRDGVTNQERQAVLQSPA